MNSCRHVFYVLANLITTQPAVFGRDVIFADVQLPKNTFSVYKVISSSNVWIFVLLRRIRAYLSWISKDLITRLVVANDGLVVAKFKLDIRQFYLAGNWQGLQN